MKNVRCDRCKRFFQIRLKERPMRDGGAQQFFRCPYCYHTYTVANITAEGLRIRRQMQMASPEQLSELRKRMAQEVNRP